MMVIAARMIVIIQKRIVIFDSWIAVCGFLNTYLMFGSSWSSVGRNVSCRGARFISRCFTPLLVPN